MAGEVSGFAVLLTHVRGPQIPTEGLISVRMLS